MSDYSMLLRFFGIAMAGVLALSRPSAARDDRLTAHMTILGLTLMQSTFHEAQSILGKAEVRHNQGDGAASASVACFVGRDGTTLALVSNTEMGQGKTITSYQLLKSADLMNLSGGGGASYVAPQNARPPCVSSRRLSHSTADGGGLRLGMSVSEVRTMLGAPVESSKDSLSFVTTRAEPYLRRVLQVEFIEGKVVAIRAEPDIF